MKTPPVIFLPLSEPKGNGRLNRFITYFTSDEQNERIKSTDGNKKIEKRE